MLTKNSGKKIVKKYRILLILIAILIAFILIAIGTYLFSTLEKNQVVNPNMVSSDTEFEEQQTLMKPSASPSTANSQKLPSINISKNWKPVKSTVWGPSTNPEEGKVWSIELALPPGFDYISTGSEEYVTSIDDPTKTWDFHLSQISGSRRQQYLTYITTMGGFWDDEPLNKCELETIDEIKFNSLSSYLDISATCRSNNSDGTIYTSYHAAYLYVTQGMLLTIVKNSENKADIPEPDLKIMLSSIKLGDYQYTLEQ